MRQMQQDFGAEFVADCYAYTQVGLNTKTKLKKQRI